MEVIVYTFEDSDGNEVSGGFHTQNYADAKAYGLSGGYRVIANTFEWADSEMVDDFTSREEVSE